MRTTIRLHDELARQMKALAQETGQTFTSLVEQGCVAVLKARGSPAKPRKLKPLPTVDLGGWAEGVDREHPNRILAELDGDLLPTLTFPTEAEMERRAPKQKRQ